MEDITGHTWQVIFSIDKRGGSFNYKFPLLYPGKNTGRHVEELGNGHGSHLLGDEHTLTTSHKSMQMKVKITTLNN